MTEKPGQFVAQFKMTVIITKGKTTAITGLPINEDSFKSEFSIKDEEILKLLAVFLYLFRLLCRKRRRRKNDVYLRI